MSAPMMLCRIAWMERYEGVRHGDRPRALARFIKKNGVGAEIFNFQNLKGRVFGYPELNGRISIERLGADPADDKVDGVTVVWCARWPNGGVYVVGWYKNATVYRDYDLAPMPRGRSRLPGEKEGCPWRISASANNAKLLEPDDRTFRLPKAFVNQTMVRYLDESTSATRKLRGDLERLVAGKTEPKVKGRKAARGWNSDPQQRAKVEAAAIDAVTRHFEKKGYSIESVERENCGWDLTASLGSKELQIEVKGRAGKDPVAELTPNEYKHLLKCLPNYRLCIVTSALNRPKLHLIIHNEEGDRWVSDSANATIKKRIAATIHL